MVVQGGMGVAFVPDPATKGRWIRTYPCVVSVDCPVCRAAAGVPCIGSDKQYVSMPHADRRTAADIRGKLLVAEPAVMFRLP